MPPDIRVRRVYDDPAADDGVRILVDRVWPRGLRKAAARLDDWARDVAPSAELRNWYRHDPAKAADFRRRYLAELAMPEPRKALARIRALAAGAPLTLLTATRDLRLSQAAVLAEVLRAADAGETADAACWAHLVCPGCGAVVSEGHRTNCRVSPDTPA